MDGWSEELAEGLDDELGLFSIEDAYPLTGGREYVYAVLVQAVKQHYVAHELPNFFPCKAINPILVRRKWTRGAYQEVMYSLMPGYVFLFSDEPMEPGRLRGLDGVLKVLQYDDGEYALTSTDEQIARWLVKYDGTIGLSKAIRTGDTIQVIEGPLKEQYGVVTNVDKRKKRAKIEMRFNGVVFSTWLDFDWVEA